jgi:hypothetical protein
MGNAWKAKVDEATARILRRSARPVVGCSEQELQQFQAFHGIELPASYLRYLRAVGKDCGTFLIGTPSGA